MSCNQRQSLVQRLTNRGRPTEKKAAFFGPANVDDTQWRKDKNLLLWAGWRPVVYSTWLRWKQPITGRYYSTAKGAEVIRTDLRTKEWRPEYLKMRKEDWE